ncbi:MAG: hypothetical protein ACOY3C_05025 [Bacillota bacterium]
MLTAEGLVVIDSLLPQDGESLRDRFAGIASDVRYLVYKARHPELTWSSEGGLRSSSPLASSAGWPRWTGSMIWMSKLWCPATVSPEARRFSRNSEPSAWRWLTGSMPMMVAPLQLIQDLEVISGQRVRRVRVVSQAHHSRRAWLTLRKYWPADDLASLIP